MGGNMARRRAGDGHTVVAHHRDAAAMRELAEAGVRADDDLAGLVAKLAVLLLYPPVLTLATLSLITFNAKDWLSRPVPLVVRAPKSAMTRSFPNPTA